MENKGLVMTRNQILCHVWGYDFDGETRTVDVHVRTLRQKLGEAGNLVETVRGVATGSEHKNEKKDIKPYLSARSPVSAYDIPCSESGHVQQV